jgi:CRISPR-associated protein Cmr5
MSTRQTVEQERARRAMECVIEVSKHETWKGKYGSLARRAPADIQSNGLGQTLAFWKSKPKDKENAILYDHVSTWVCERLNEWQGKDLLTQLIAANTTTADYRRATAEAQAFLIWLKRFAEAELD